VGVVVPLLAVAIVAGLAIRAFADRGPLITISFSDAEASRLAIPKSATRM